MAGYYLLAYKNGAAFIFVMLDRQNFSRIFGRSLLAAVAGALVAQTYASSTIFGFELVPERESKSKVWLHTRDSVGLKAVRGQRVLMACAAALNSVFTWVHPCHPYITVPVLIKYQGHHNSDRLLFNEPLEPTREVVGPISTTFHRHRTPCSSIGEQRS